MPKKILILLILIISFSLLVFGLRWVEKAEAGPDHNVWGWAWSNMERPVGDPEGEHDQTIGWISFNCTDREGATGKTCVTNVTDSTTELWDYGVNIDSNGYLSGHAWSEHIGWLSFDRDRTNNPPGDPFQAGPGPIAVVESDGTVSGWARALSACQDDLWDDVTKRCTGSGAGNRAGGWDGWIKLRDVSWPAADGVSIDFGAGPPAEFEGWAWSSEVIGWVSFNTANYPGGSDYKVMTNFTPPVVVSNLTWNFPDSCAQSRIPTFTWVVDTTDPFDYQIRLCSDAGCATELVSEERSGVNSGYWTPSCSFCCSVAPYNNINFGGITYNTQVRTRHVGAEWLDNWANVDFTTYEHCYPWVDFNWSPKPVEVGPDVDFEDKFTCYDVPIGDRCGYNIATPSHTWAFPGIEGTNYECINPAVNCGFAQDPKIKFLTTLTSGSQVYLEVCDSLNYCCLGNKPITVILPLPEYREVRPRSQLDNFLARIAGIFR